MRERTFFRRLMRKVCESLGLPSGSSRRVRFQPEASVYEFERQLAGGGGVPDGDAVALGLGPKCVNTYLSPLAEKQDKNEYAFSGYLDVQQRAQLLSEWAVRSSIKEELDRVRPEFERLQRAREETASNPKDQRFMPSNIDEALVLASHDEEEVLLQTCRIKTPQRAMGRKKGSECRASIRKRTR